MKLPLLLALSLSAAAALATSAVDPPDHGCHFYNTEEACIQNSEGGEPCYWCKSAAVHSMCYNETEAKQLPPAIFQCDKKKGGLVFDQNIINLAAEENEIDPFAEEFVKEVAIFFDEEEIVDDLVEDEIEDFLIEMEPMNDGCHSSTSRDSCLKNTEGGKPCYWCKCSAVPSSCYNETEALQLPPAVFQCEKETFWGPLEEINWALTEMPHAVALKELYGLWKLKYNKEDNEDDEKRFKAFQENANVVVSHNKKALSYTLELNRFADMAWSDFKRFYLGSLPQNCSATHTTRVSVEEDEVPEAIDWRRWGAVSPVKDQGMCGSCWTFSTTGCLESHNMITHGKKILLSEQNLIDCAQNFDNHGCNGGLPSHAFEYIKFNGGLDTGASYPYHAKDEACKYSPTSIGVQVVDVVNITSTDENELRAAVGTVGPVSIAFQVSSDFQLYKDGVYDSTQCKSGVLDVNHAVLAIGYNTTDDGHKYWIVKNSWSSKWGMDGYFHIARDKNMCGLADCASYPIV